MDLQANTAGQQTAPKIGEPILDKLGRSYATGKRKTSIARLWLGKGSGAFSVNGKTLNEYFVRDSHKIDILKPLKVVELEGKFDIKCTVIGGGVTGQAGAVRHALSKAIVCFHPAKRKDLRHEGLLTRDSRTVEPKRYGRRKARKKAQFSKR